LEGKDSVRTNQSRQGAQNRNGIGKKHQNETAHGGIERLAALDLVHVGLDEAHMVQAGAGHANSGPRDRARIALYPHHLPRRTNQSGRQHCNVSDSGTDIQNTLTWTNACFTEESFGNRGETRSLSDQALVLRVRAAKHVIKGGIVHCYLSGGSYST